MKIFHIKCKKRPLNFSNFFKNIKNPLKRGFFICFLLTMLLSRQRQLLSDLCSIVFLHASELYGIGALHQLLDLATGATAIMCSSLVSSLFRYLSLWMCHCAAFYLLINLLTYLGSVVSSFFVVFLFSVYAFNLFNASDSKVPSSTFG